jgi:hypothetical protein
MTLASGQEVTRRLTLTGIPFSMAAVRIVGRAECRAIDDAATTFAVWEQARTALTAAQITARARAVTATTVTYERTMDPDFRQILEQSTAIHSEFVTEPWQSLAARTVRQVGYVTTDRDGSTTYSVPGLDVLLSSTFLEDHCFSLTNGDDKRRIGISFEPTRERGAKRDIGEIRGRIWLDRASSELRSLDFRYVNVSPEQEANSGGAMEFVRLKNGAWAISSWNIRMPELEQRIRSRALGGSDLRVASIKVTGGELALATQGQDTLWARAPLVLSGTIRDSAPAAGARVRLAGTALSDTADSRRSLVRDYSLDAADSASGAKKTCYAQVYLDRHFVYHGRPAEPLFDINSIPPDRIEAIEYYASPAQTPAMYTQLNSTCGVVVIWTRRSP